MHSSGWLFPMARVRGTRDAGAIGACGRFRIGPDSIPDSFQIEKNYGIRWRHVWYSRPSNEIAMTKSPHEETQPVELPVRIVDRVEKRLPRTEWDDPAEYITYVMEEVLYRVEKDTEDDDFEPVDEEEVKDRLKSLGYLDG